MVNVHHRRSSFSLEELCFAQSVRLPDIFESVDQFDQFVWVVRQYCTVKSIQKMMIDYRRSLECQSEAEGP
jgi:hypothetical protein